MKLDRDDGRAFPLWRLWWVMRLMGWRASWVEYQRSRRGWHVFVAVRERLRPVEVVAAQAVLGSDRNREAFNLARARLIESGHGRVQGNPARVSRRTRVQLKRWHWNVLFDRKL